MDSRCKTIRAVALGTALLLVSVVGCAGCRWGSDGAPAAPANETPQDPELSRLPEHLRSLPPEARAVLARRANGEVLADLFRDITRESGIDVTYHNGQEANHYAILESLGGGVGLIDFDRDGLLDVFVPAGGFYDGPGDQTDQIKGHPCRFYKNLGHGKFKDITKEVGLDQPLFYTHGCAVADYDRDGWPDLLVTGWGRVVLYHNEPVDPHDPSKGRRFRDVSQQAGLTAKLWSTSAAWADLDGDGYPDLYVCQYVNWDLKENDPPCHGYNSGIPRDVCPPKSFTGLPHKVYRNNGNGTFTDVSKEARLRPNTGDSTKDAENGKGLGVVIVDVDDDGKPDIFVANDTVDKFLYINKSTPGHILFEEVGLQSGVARDDRGIPNGSMGVGVADYNLTGRPSLWCTNYEHEMHGLYRNEGRGSFNFNTQWSGIAALGQTYVAFGTGFLDLDNRGFEDLVISNGHVIRFPKDSTLKQKPVLMRNRGSQPNGVGKFAEITRQGGDYFRGAHIGRGVAIGDLDNDGLPDLIISHLNDPVVVLHNEANVSNHWLGIELVGKDYRDLVGARVVVEVGKRRLTRFVVGGGSYLSASDKRLLFGLGTVEKIDKLTVVWKPGQEQVFPGDQLKTDHYWRLQEGKSQPEDPG
jgi:hypothetical protein